jgi:serine/threonine protein phosphatase PrpC
MVAAQALNSAPVLQCWAPGVASATAALRPHEPCGDAAAWWPGAGPAGTGLVAIIDGLGHGAEAALVAQHAVHTLGESQAVPAVQAASAAQRLAELMQRLDSALSSLRGAAVGLVQLGAGRLWHLGVGNTRAVRWRPGAGLGAQPQALLTRLPSHNGIVGGGLPARLGVTELDTAPGDWLLLFTDGLDERLHLPVLLPEWQRDPTLLCQHLLQLQRPGRDDAGVLVMQLGVA